MSLKNADRQTRLQWFARQVIDAMWNSFGDVDGGDIQDWAAQAGLLVEDTVTKENHDTIIEGECLDVGDTFYRFSPDLIEVDWGQIGQRKGAVNG